MTSAVNPLRVAVVTALEATSVGQSVFHEGDVSRDTPLPYLVLGAATEGRGTFYQRAGHDGTVQIKCWAEDSWAAQVLYEEVETALDGVTLTVAGHQLIQAEVSRLTDFAEPNPEVGGHVVIALLRTRSLVGA